MNDSVWERWARWEREHHPEFGRWIEGDGNCSHVTTRLVDDSYWPCLECLTCGARHYFSMAVVATELDAPAQVHNTGDGDPATAALLLDYLLELVRLDSLHEVDFAALRDIRVHLQAIRDGHPWRYAATASGWWPPSGIRIAAAARVRRTHGRVAPSLSRSTRELAHKLGVPLPLRRFWL